MQQDAVQLQGHNMVLPTSHMAQHVASIWPECQYNLDLEDTLAVAKLPVWKAP